MRKLRIDELRRVISPDEEIFRNICRIARRVNVGKNEKIIIGQEDAIDVINLYGGSMTKRKNIFVAGPDGVGKVNVIKMILEKLADEMLAPSDWCYVRDLQNYERVKILRFPAGKAKIFLADIKECLTMFSDKMADNRGCLNEISQIDQTTNYKISSNMENLAREIGEDGVFELYSEDGITFFLQSLISEEQIIAENKQAEVNKKANEFSEKIRIVLGINQQLVVQANSVKIQIFQNHAENSIRTAFESFLQKYSNMPDVFAFAHNGVFFMIEKFREALSKVSLTTGEFQFPSVDFFNQLVSALDVNMLVDNSNVKNAPIIEDYDCTYESLFGEHVKEVDENGRYIDSLYNFRAGAAHRANGGYLIIRMPDLIDAPLAGLIWRKLKKIIQKQEIDFISEKDAYSAISVKELKTDPIPLKIKVILVGDHLWYNFLKTYDEKFARLFEKAEMEDIIDISESDGIRINNIIVKYLKYVFTSCKQNNLLSVSDDAAARLIEYGMELAEAPQKLSLKMGKIKRLLEDADVVARKHKKEMIDADSINKALDTQRKGQTAIKKIYLEHIKKGILKIDTDGEKIGQINGLVVYEYSGNEFAIPTKITARTFAGDAGVISIERDVGLGLKTHNRAIATIRGFLNGEYGKNKPMSLSASVGFEQNYGYIDGDSATLAEMVAIISSFIEVPILQKFAITGSMNQFGEAQAIGAVNYKINGFFNVCEQRGLTGQGVIIPMDNVRDLMLPVEIVEAVEKKQFFIYSVESLGGALELLTGLKISEINERVSRKLMKMKSRDINLKDKSKDKEKIN